MKITQNLSKKRIRKFTFITTILAIFVTIFIVENNSAFAEVIIYEPIEYEKVIVPEEKIVLDGITITRPQHEKLVPINLEQRCSNNNGKDIIEGKIDLNSKHITGAKLLNERTVIPLRSIFEELDANVKWDANDRKITITKDRNEITLVIDSNKPIVNGKTTSIDVPAKIIDSKTYVPLRFISEAIGANVDWDSSTNRAVISNEEKKIYVHLEDGEMKLLLGETFSNDKIRLRIDKVEYFFNDLYKHKFGNDCYGEKGFRVYYEIENKSDTPLLAGGGSLKFKTEQGKFENSGWLSISGMDNENVLYNGDVNKGYTFFIYDRGEVTVNEISFSLAWKADNIPNSVNSNHEDLGTWWIVK